MNKLRGDCRLERANLRHTEVRKHVTKRNIVINTSRLIVIMLQFKMADQRLRTLTHWPSALMAWYS